MPLLPAVITLPLFLLIGTFFLTAVVSSLRQLRKFMTKEELSSFGFFWLYRPVLSRLFPGSSFEALVVGATVAQNICRLSFGMSALIAGLQLDLISIGPDSRLWTWSGLVLGVSLLLFIAVSILISDFIPRSLAARYPRGTLRSSSPLATFYLLINLPFSLIFIYLFKQLQKGREQERDHQPMDQLKEKVIEILESAAEEPKLDPNEKKLIESAMSFRDRIAREAMVPRVDVFSLPAEMPIIEAAELLTQEGYSRAPIYKGNVDNIIGLLMYRDVMGLYLQCNKNLQDPKLLETPIETIAKDVLYTPETKKISDILQEFRNRQTHFAVVVDEYGGTEGILTIEDILEEIVGDISDEYDEEDELFQPEPNGSWLIDARMNILDIEAQLGLKIPQDGEYDTIGGYVFHRAGAVPSEGLVIHHDDFELEIISSTDRCVEKVRARKIKLPEANEESEPAT